MSTMAIEEALSYLTNNPTTEEAQDMVRHARTELEAIRKAAAAIDDAQPIQLGLPDELVSALDLMEVIAKESP